MKYLILFLSTLFSTSLFSQDTIQKFKKYDYAFSPGVIVQENVFNEFNIIIGTVSSQNWTVGIVGTRIGFESNFKYDKDFIIAPKVGYEISMILVSLRLSAANYFQNKESEFRIIPEMGLSFGGAINLTYGYGFSLNHSDINGLSNHRLSLTFNINDSLY